MIFTLPSKYEEWYTGLILQLEINKGNPIKWQMIPIRQSKNEFRLSLLTDTEKDKILSEVEDYSKIITDDVVALDVLKNTIQSFNEARASQAAAGMAYYAFFSLFPLLLGLVALGSFVLESQRVYQEVIDLVAEAFPTSESLIRSNIDHVFSLRGPVGVIGLISLLWSGSGIFTTLAYNINLAWPKAQQRNLLEKRLVGLGMIGMLIGLLLLSLISTAALSLLPKLEVPLGGGVSIYDTLLWAFLTNLVPWLFTFLLFFGLYRWVPNTQVGWIEAIWGAAAAALAWRIATHAFAWYLNSGLVSYQLVYGSLGAVVALLFWIYLSSLITLFGAHLSAAIARHAGR